MTEMQLKLFLLITDELIELVDRLRRVSSMSDEEVLESIKEERIRKDTLVKEVTSP